MNPLKLVPGYVTVNHVSRNLGEGVRQDGALGAAKVLAKGLSKDWALGLTAAVVPGGQALSAATLAASTADTMGALAARRR
jgi:hypothetical protein